MGLLDSCNTMPGHHCPRARSGTGEDFWNRHHARIQSGNWNSQSRVYNTGPRIQEYSNWEAGAPNGRSKIQLTTGLEPGRLGEPEMRGRWSAQKDSEKRLPICQGLCAPSVPPPAAPPLPPLAPCQDVVVTIWNPTRDWAGLDVALDGVTANLSSVDKCVPSPSDCSTTDDCCFFDFAVCRQPGCFTFQIVGTPMPPHLYWYAPGPPTPRPNIHSHLTLNPPPPPGP